MERTSFIVDLIVGNNEETGKSISQCWVGALPRVGEQITVITHRDESGNYINADLPAWDNGVFRDLGTYTVTAIQHTIEERGKSAATHHWRHFAQVFLTPVESANI